ncbi:MAG TPA: hypothetical protein VGC75_03165 [Candidatus Nitrosocosmicus sp.]|jgi:hypothetical protein
MKKNNKHKTKGKLKTIYNSTEIIYVVVDMHFRVISCNIRAIEFAKRELGISIGQSEYILGFFPEHNVIVMKKIQSRPIHIQPLLSGTENKT